MVFDDQLAFPNTRVHYFSESAHHKLKFKTKLISLSIIYVYTMKVELFFILLSIIPAFLTCSVIVFENNM